MFRFGISFPSGETLPFAGKNERTWQIKLGQLCGEESSITRPANDGPVVPNHRPLTKKDVFYELAERRFWGAFQFMDSSTMHLSG
jgi:hypothetical protein